MFFFLTIVEFILILVVSEWYKVVQSGKDK